MRITPKNFTGFVCGQYYLGFKSGQTFEGVMEFKDGVAVKLYLPCYFIKIEKLYQDLKAGLNVPYYCSEIIEMPNEKVKEKVKEKVS